MKSWMIVFFSFMSVGCQTMPAAQDHDDHIHKSLAGLMSPGLDIYINLETGVMWSISSRIGLAGSPSHKSSRRLTAKQLASLKEAVRRAMIEGPISEQCKYEDQAAKDRGDPPINRQFNDDDGMSSFEVQLEGKTQSVSDGICESSAFTQLENTVYDLGNFK